MMIGKRFRNSLPGKSIVGVGADTYAFQPFADTPDDLPVEEGNGSSCPFSSQAVPIEGIRVIEEETRNRIQNERRRRMKSQTRPYIALTEEAAKNVLCVGHPERHIRKSLSLPDDFARNENDDWARDSDCGYSSESSLESFAMRNQGSSEDMTSRRTRPMIPQHTLLCLQLSPDGVPVECSVASISFEV